MSAYNFVMNLILIIGGSFPSLCYVSLHCRVGHSLTLYCNCQDADIVMCYWYKQAIGQKTVKITSYNKLGLKKDLSKVDPRFTLNNTDNYNNLKIKDLHFSDAATYFCMSSNLYNVDFLEAITLDVEGAGFHFTTSVFELMPENSGIRSSATMDGCFDNGIFSGEHGVYWFSPSKESGKGVLYSHGGNTDQGESNTDSSTNSCIYNLPIPDGHATRDWTTCAVTLCGKLLTGTKSKSNSEDKDVASVLVHLLIGGLVVTLILSLLLVLAIYKLRKKSPPALNIENEEDIHYAALMHHSSNRATRQADSNNTEYVYSSVRL